MRTNSLRELLPTYVTIIVAVTAIGAADWVTGYELSFFVFYFFPVALASWRINAMSSYVVSLLCALVWFFVDQHSGHVYTKPWIEFWNTAVRFIAFIIIGHTVARIQSLLAVAHKEVKILSGLLPICAQCKKIRDDKGYWHQIELYISKHTEADFTHGLCERCARDALRKAGIEGKSAEPTNPPDSEPAARSPQG